MKNHVFLKHRMGAHQNIDLACGQSRQFFAPLGPLIAPRQNRQANARIAGQRGQPLDVLAGQNLGRGHHHALPACLDRHQQRHKSHQRFARPHIALQQSVHAQRRCHIGGNFSNRAGLRARWLVWQRRQNPVLQGARAPAGHPARPAHPRAGQRQCQLMRHQLVIGQTRARRCISGQIIRARGRMGHGHGAVPIRPAGLGFLRRVNPFGQLRHPRQGPLHSARHQLLRHARRQRIHRLECGNGAGLGQGQHMIGMHHLRHAIKQLDPPRYNAGLPGGQ